jgi:hypothetical protein
MCIRDRPWVPLPVTKNAVLLEKRAVRENSARSMAEPGRAAQTSSAAAAQRMSFKWRRDMAAGWMKGNAFPARNIALGQLRAGTHYRGCDFFSVFLAKN